ncbi:MAG: hypothetical protein H7Y38_15035 [Armatimonadetes bacterium]|nr:hypothetical protein [Armatimonadota bacterium]
MPKYVPFLVAFVAVSTMLMVIGWRQLLVARPVVPGGDPKQAGVLLNTEYVSLIEDDWAVSEVKYVLKGQSVDIYGRLNTATYIICKDGKEHYASFADPTAPYKITKSDVAHAVAKPGDWYCYLRNTPVEYGASSVKVDWTKCQPETTCGEMVNDTETEIFDVVSDGMVLQNAVTDGVLHVK